MKLWSFKRPQPETKSAQNPAGADCVSYPHPSILGGSAATNVALRIPAVANAVQIISEACATLDIAVVEVSDGVETKIADHPVSALLMGEVNDWTTGFEFIRSIVFDALTDSRGGLAWVNRLSNGEIYEVLRYAPGFIVIDTDSATGKRSYTINGQSKDQGEIIHLLPPLGVAPLALAWEAVKVAASLSNHANGLFSNGARPAGVLKFPSNMKEDAVKKAMAAWRKAHETAEGQGRTAILYDGAEFQPLTFSSTDAQFTEVWRFTIQEIARAFNIPSPMVGDLERATWGNAEQKGREFLSYTLEPWLRGLEGALGRALLTEEERQTLAIRFDRDDLTRADLSTRATVINSLISAKAINPNEGRSWIGLPPRKGGDEFLNPNTETTQRNFAPSKQDQPDEPK